MECSIKLQKLLLTAEGLPEAVGGIQISLEKNVRDSDNAEMEVSSISDTDTCSDVGGEEAPDRFRTSSPSSRRTSPDRNIGARTNTRGQKRQHALSVNGDNGDTNDAEDPAEELQGPSTRSKKTKGRQINPEHKGMYTAEKKAERKAERARIMQEEEDALNLSFVEDLSTPEKRSRRWWKEEDKGEELMEKLENLPHGDIAAHILEQVSVVRKVAQVSKNLKGDLAKQLWKASTMIKAGSTALTKRAMGGQTGLVEETYSLRQARGEIEELRKRNAELLGELEEMRRWREASPLTSGLTPPPPPAISQNIVDEVDMVEGAATPFEPQRPETTREEREKFPAMRPAIRGVSVRIPSPSPPRRVRGQGTPGEGSLKEALMSLISEILKELDVTPRVTSSAQRNPQGR